MQFETALELDPTSDVNILSVSTARENVLMMFVFFFQKTTMSFLALWILCTALRLSLSRERECVLFTMMKMIVTVLFIVLTFPETNFVYPAFGEGTVRYCRESS